MRLGIFFRCLLAIHTASFLKCLFKSFAHFFFNGWFSLPSYWAVRLTSWIKFSGIWSTNIFPICGLSFHFLDGFMKFCFSVQFIIFSLITCAFCVTSNQHSFLIINSQQTGKKRIVFNLKKNDYKIPVA